MRDGVDTQKPLNSSNIGNLSKARNARRRSEWGLSMSERLARVHHLCKQVNALRGTARR
jgi:hypothetical protein